MAARHVAIIADGNHRWALCRGLPAAAGHVAAADALKARIGDAIALGIERLTVFVFSTENWSRPAREVDELMEMFAARIALEAPQLDAEDVRMRFSGRRENLAPALLLEMDRAQALTERNSRLLLTLAFNYGGRAEILDAARRFQGGGEQDFAACLYDAGTPDPELIIRTGGEQRLSNFLLWQSAYAELLFSPELWPDFDRASFEACLHEFELRARRFGGRE